MDILQNRFLDKLFSEKATLRWPLNLKPVNESLVNSLKNTLRCWFLVKLLALLNTFWWLLGKLFSVTAFCALWNFLKLFYVFFLPYRKQPHMVSKWLLNWMPKFSFLRVYVSSEAFVLQGEFLKVAAITFFTQIK